MRRATSLDQYFIPIIQDDGLVHYFPDFLSCEASDQLLAKSIAEILWEQDQIKLFGRIVKVPRLSAWFSQTNTTYRYSGLTHQPKQMPEFIKTLLHDVVVKTGVEFNSILVNLYRDGNDSMGLHADDEAELGPAVNIASLSVGVPRTLVFRHRYNKLARIALPVAHGSLLMMYSPLQKYWMHELPKRKNVAAPRVNFSFRVIQSA